MDATDIRKEYLEWLCQTVSAGPKWHLLWYKLHSMAFVWTIAMDENRAADGQNLRYLYSLEVEFDGLSSVEIDDILSGPCSVMEFLVGLARRIEDDIMYDVDAENRTSKWFWMMIRNLGLDIYDDRHYDDVEIEGIVNRFMSRKYDENGSKGGPKNIFKIGPGAKNMQIWEQAQAWSNEF